MSAVDVPFSPASASQPGSPEPSIPVAYAVAVLASVIFGLAIVPRNGQYDAAALALVASGLLMLLLILREQQQRRTTVITGSAIPLLARLIWVALFGIAWAARDDIWLLVSVRTPWTTGRIVQSLLILLLATYLPALLTRRVREGVLWRHMRFAMFAVVVLLGGCVVLHVSPHPTIDVWYLQQDGAQLLSTGHNPYPSVAVQDTGARPAPAVPYTYPPLQLYATLPAFMLGGDVRYTMVVAVVLAGLALRTLAFRRDRIPSLVQDAPALLLWLTPKMFLILEQAWVDVVALALVCWAVWAHRSARHGLSAILFGLAFAAKQPMLWLIPLVGLLPGFSRRQLLLALGTAAATILPFVMWDWRALYNATVAFVVQQPAPPEALTLLNWCYFRTGYLPPTWLGGLLAATVVAVALWGMVRSVSSFSLATAVTFAVLFVFNKIAYANYYYLVLGLAALAAAVSLNDPAMDVSQSSGATEVPSRRTAALRLQRRVASYRRD